MFARFAVRSRRRRALPVAVACAALLPATATTAHAAQSIAYLDGKEVWVANLDGSVKTRLSTGQGDWTAVAQNDAGWIVGMELESGKTPYLGRFTVWNPAGAEVRHGPFSGAHPGSLAAFPLGLNITADGGLIVYGYSEYIYGYPVGQLYKGFYALPSSTVVAPAGGPLSNSSAQYVTLGPNDRVVGTASDSIIAYQGTGGIGDTTFTNWLDFGLNSGYSLENLNLSADGSVLGSTVRDSTVTPNASYVNVLKANAFTGQYVDDCFIEQSPTTKAEYPSVSADGTRIAWSDAGGVKIAGVPTFAPGGPAICNLSSPAVTIAPTGSYPSIGGFDLGAYLAARAPAGGGSTGGAGGAGGGGSAGGASGAGSTGSGGGAGPSGAAGATGEATLAITLSGKPKAPTGSSTTVSLKVTTNQSGKATFTLSAKPKTLGVRGKKPVTLGKVTKTVTAGRQATVKVKLTARGTSLMRRLKNKKLMLTTVIGGVTTTTTVKLR